MRPLAVECCPYYRARQLYRFWAIKIKVCICRKGMPDIPWTQAKPGSVLDENLAIAL
jgi:hypothetical protein